MEENKEKLKFDAFLREYSEMRQEYRTYEVLQIICISLSALTFVILFIAAVDFPLLYHIPFYDLVIELYDPCFFPLLLCYG
jgi:hypothetical protein